MKRTHPLNTVRALAVTTSAPPARTTIGLILVGCALMFLVLQIGTTWLTGRFDMTWSALIATSTMLGLALLLEKLFFKRGRLPALRALGFRRPNPPALAVAGIIALIMLAFFPLFTLVTGIPVSLRSDWWWILIGAVALNGIAEETLFRGYVFGGLRRSGLSFGRAGGISLVIFAAVHLLLFIQNPFLIALLGTLVAIAAAFPMAYLFERGNNALWAPVMLHVAAHAIRLVDVPEPYYLTAVTAWLVLQLGAPFLVLAFRRNLLKRHADRDS